MSEPKLKIGTQNYPQPEVREDPMPYLFAPLYCSMQPRPAGQERKNIIKLLKTQHYTTL